MTGAASRRKGHQFERQLAIWLREIFPNARRQLEYQENQCKGIDLAETGRYKFQCKKLKRYASITAIFEVQCEESLDEVPVLVTAGDRQPPMAVLPLEEFLRLVKIAEKA